MHILETMLRLFKCTCLYNLPVKMCMCLKECSSLRSNAQAGLGCALMHAGKDSGANFDESAAKALEQSKLAWQKVGSGFLYKSCT